MKRHDKKFERIVSEFLPADQVLVFRPRMADLLGVSDESAAVLGLNRPRLAVISGRPLSDTEYLAAMHMFLRDENESTGVETGAERPTGG